MHLLTQAPNPAPLLHAAHPPGQPRPAHHARNSVPVHERVSNAYWAGLEAGRDQGRAATEPGAYRAGWRWGFLCGGVLAALAWLVAELLGPQLAVWVG